jgi:hypothetical protein
VFTLLGSSTFKVFQKQFLQPDFMPTCMQYTSTMAAEAPKRANTIAVLHLKVPFDKWHAGFQSDSEKRAATGFMDESRTKAFKLDDSTALIRMYDVNLGGMRGFLAEPERAALIAAAVESSEMFVAAPAPPAPASA